MKESVNGVEAPIEGKACLWRRSSSMLMASQSVFCIAKGKKAWRRKKKKRGNGEERGEKERKKKKLKKEEEDEEEGGREIISPYSVMATRAGACNRDAKENLHQGEKSWLERRFLSL